MVLIAEAQQIKAKLVLKGREFLNLVGKCDWKMWKTGSLNTLFFAAIEYDYESSIHG